MDDSSGMTDGRGSEVVLADGYYGFEWWSGVVPAIALLSSLALFILGVLVTVLAFLAFRTTHFWWILATLLVPLMGGILLCSQGAKVTPIRLTPQYLQCYLFFVVPIGVPWSSVWLVQRLPGWQYWVYASALTPCHSLGPVGLLNPRYRCLQLTPGLHRREEIFREIVRRASIARGQEVPIIG